MSIPQTNTNDLSFSQIRQSFGASTGNEQQAKARKVIRVTKKFPQVLNAFAIVGSTWLANVSYRVSVNPFEVVRVRMIKDLINPTLKTLHSPSINCGGSLTSMSMFAAFRHLWKEDAKQLFASGLKEKIFAGLLRSGTFFILYESLNQQLKRAWTSNKKRDSSLSGSLQKTFAPSALSSAVARMIAVTISYPLEYRSVALQSMSGYQSRLNKSFNRNMMTGYSNTIGRELVLTVGFWPVYELFKEYFKQNFIHNPVLSSSASSVVSSFASSLIAYPFDLVQTLKISHESEYSGKSSLSIFRNLLRQKGMRPVLQGLKPFAMKNCFGSFVFFTVYEWAKGASALWQSDEEIAEDQC